tara:strand:+ start:467 stop:712 length:246 start_codon:yes stop_codon:yes gene_type:complete
MDRFTVTKTKRWGNADTQISNVYSVNRNKARRDDVIKIANDMITREEVYTNESVEFEVLLTYDSGNTEFIHRVEKEGKKSL